MKNAYVWVAIAVVAAVVLYQILKNPSQRATVGVGTPAINAASGFVGSVSGLLKSASGFFDSGNGVSAGGNDPTIAPTTPVMPDAIDFSSIDEP